MKKAVVRTFFVAIREFPGSDHELKVEGGSI